MGESTISTHWLELYASNLHDWHYEATDEDTPYDLYSRRLGIVESMFDADGLYWEGRADVHPEILLEMKTALSRQQLRDRLSLAWTLIRHTQILLACSATYLQASSFTEKRQHWNDKHFTYRRPKTVEAAIIEACQHIVFLEDDYSSINPADFRLHAMNTARGIDPAISLSKLFIFPSATNDRGYLEQRFMLVLGHEVVDGMAIYQIGNLLVGFMNEESSSLENRLGRLLTRGSQDDVLSRLPPAQESLYPNMAYSKARSRWHWAITRMLRHVRKPLPTAFPNPLRREEPLEHARPFPPSYSKVLDYSRLPCLNTAPFHFHLPSRAVQNLARMCKEAGITVGSGCFTFVAMTMMHFEELRNPNTPLAERRPFVGGFPVNPRPFLSKRAAGQGSCMLAFSDGVVLPFLPQELDFKGRFRVLGRLAHRQLGQYQKRKRSAEGKFLSSRSPGQLIPQMYLFTLARVEGMVQEGDATRKVNYDIFGEYPPAPAAGLSTCGVSSVGDTSGILSVGKYDVTQETEKDTIADLLSLEVAVRPREGEFLVGVVGTKTTLEVAVSCDANALDPEKMQKWKELVTTILDKELFEDTKTVAKHRSSQPESKL